jgi:transposase
MVALVDALGNLSRFLLLPGHRHDSLGVEPLLEGVAIGALIGDKAFDSDSLRRQLAQQGILAVIPPMSHRKAAIACDFAMYRWRHLIENFFCKIKHFRRIATRYEKTDTSYTAMIHLVAAKLALT